MTEAYNVAVGRALRMRRERKGARQVDVARACGMSQANYSRLENGEIAITVDQLRLASAAVGVQASDVLQDVEWAQRFGRK